MNSLTDPEQSQTEFKDLVDRATSQFDCELDGEIEQDDYQRIACLRTPEG